VGQDRLVLLDLQDHLGLWDLREQKVTRVHKVLQVQQDFRDRLDLLALQATMVSLDHLDP